MLEIGGSNPPTGTTVTMTYDIDEDGAVTQGSEVQSYKLEVGGSIPPRPTIFTEKD